MDAGQTGLEWRGGGKGQPQCPGHSGLAQKAEFPVLVWARPVQGPGKGGERPGPVAGGPWAQSRPILSTCVGRSAPFSHQISPLPVKQASQALAGCVTTGSSGQGSCSDTDTDTWPKPKLPHSWWAERAIPPMQVRDQVESIK